MPIRQALKVIGDQGKSGNLIERVR